MTTTAPTTDLAPDRAPDYATRSTVWARQYANAAAATLDAQLKEISHSYLEKLIEVDDLRALTLLACETYVTALQHPLVVAEGLGSGGGDAA